MTQIAEIDPARCRRPRRQPTAFDELVRATYADTYTLAYRLTGNEEDARDVVQESYLRAYRGVRQFRGDAQFSTWLYRITANCASTHLGRRRRHRHDELDDDAPVIDTRPEVRPPGAGRCVGHPRSARGGARASCRPGCGPSSCCATSTTFPTRRSPPSSASRRPAAKVRLHRARRRLRERGVRPRTGEEVRACGVTRSPSCSPRPPRAGPFRRRRRGATSSTACGARPTSCSTAGCTGALRSAGRPTCSTDARRLGRGGARRARRGEPTRHAGRTLRCRRAACSAGWPRSTAAGAAERRSC